MTVGLLLWPVRHLLAPDAAATINWPEPLERDKWQQPGSVQLVGPDKAQSVRRVAAIGRSSVAPLEASMAKQNWQAEKRGHLVR